MHKNRKSCEETAMNMLRKIVMPVFGVLAILAFQVSSAAPGGPAPGPAPGTAPGGPAGAAPPGRGGRSYTPEHPHHLAPYFTPATSSPKAPDADGFLQRWLLLEPINKPNRGNTVFTDSYVRNAFKTEYFPNQFTVVPHDGDKVTVAGEELAWHALDSANFNVKLFRFAYGLNKRDLRRPVLGRDRRQQPAGDEERSPGRRLQFGVHVVAQRQGSRRPLRRSAHGDG